MSEFFDSILSLSVVVQVLAVVAILVLGFLTFKFAPLKLEIRSITFTALMVMLSVILSIFSLMVPMFGYPSLKIGFSQLPLMMVGLFLGPSWAFLAGLMEDVLELLTMPVGFPFFGFTLNKILVAMLPALWMLIPKTKIKQFKYLPHMLLGGFYLLAMAFTFTIDEVKVGQEIMEITMVTKIGIFILSTILFAFMIVMLNIITNYFKTRNLRFALTDWVIAVLLVEFVVNLLLTPLWLQTMYGIPFWFSVAPRLVKGTVMIQLNIVLGYFIVSTIERLIERRRN